MTSTAQDKFDYMRSAEGGRFMVRDEEDSTFAIIYYDKKRTDMNLPNVGVYRSMIWNKAANTAIPVAPQRARSFSQAIDDGAANFITTEFVDGTMINMVWDPANTKWVLFTRTQIGAMGHFFGTRPFAELFWEAFRAGGLTETDLDTNMAYSWVLQHPEERIVTAPPYGIPRVFLINATGPMSEKLMTFTPKVFVHLKTLEDVKEFVYSQGKRLGPQFQGVCMHTADGHRYKLRTNEYDEARYLRGNQAKRPYLWLERWAEGRLGAYLRLYPEEACDAESVVEQFKAATQELHTLYLQVYRQKLMPLGEAPQKYRKLLWELHRAGGGAYFPNVREFMNKQETARKLWVVNYEGRFGASVTTTPAEPAVSTQADVGSTTVGPPPMPSLFRSLSCTGPTAVSETLTGSATVTPQVETPA